MIVRALIRVHIAIAVLAISLSTQPVVAQASSIPVPTPITSAKSVFVANAGSMPSNNQSAILIYTSFYQRLSTGKHFLLTSDPAKADLILEVSGISLFEGGLNQAAYVQVLIRDSKTQSLLWSTAEPIQFGARQKAEQKNIADAATKLAADVESLGLRIAPSVAPDPATPTKTRYADEGKK
jgi:hypothetical protein